MAHSVLERVQQAAGGLKAFLGTPGGRRAQWGLTALFVGGSLFVAGRSLHEIHGFAGWGYAYILLLLIPSGFSVMALQFFIAGRALSVAPTFDESLRVASAATTANLLPVPGAVLVRVGALRQRGVPVKAASAMTGAVAFAVLAMSSLVSSVCLAQTSGLLAVAALGIGLLSVAAAFQLIPRSVANRRGSLVELAGVGLYVAVVNGVNLFAVFQAIGQDISLRSSVAIAASGVLASSVGIIPGGLGLREVIAGVLSLSLGYQPGIVVTAVLISRFAEIVGLVALQLHYRPRRSS
jgi:hypothetical protein